jgi:hypothetical protein
MAEDAVCNLPEIEPSDIVFASRKLKPAEIETLALRRGHVVECTPAFFLITPIADDSLLDGSIPIAKDAQ